MFDGQSSWSLRKPLSSRVAVSTIWAWTAQRCWPCRMRSAGASRLSDWGKLP